MSTEGETVNAALESLMNKVIKQYFSQNNSLSSPSSASNQSIATNDPNSKLILNMLQSLLYKQARAQQPAASANPSERTDAGISDKSTSMTTFLNQAEQLGLLDNASSQKLKLLMTSFQVLEDGASSVDRVSSPRTNDTAFPVRYNREQKLAHALSDQSNSGASTSSQTALQTAMLARLSQNRIHQDSITVKHSNPRTKPNASAHGFSPMVVFSEAAVKNLISIYGQYRQDFIGHAKDRMRAWEKVCDEMRVRGFLFTRQQCKNKWHTLVYNYRQCNEYNRQVTSVGLGGVQGYKRKECPYYKEISDIMNNDEEDVGFGQRVAPLFRPREAPRFSEVYTDTCSTPDPVESDEPSADHTESTPENPENSGSISVKTEPSSPVSSEQQTVFDYVVTSNEQGEGDSHEEQCIDVKKSDEQSGENLTDQSGVCSYNPSPEYRTVKRKFSGEDKNDLKQRKLLLGNDSVTGVMLDSSNHDTASNSHSNGNTIRSNFSEDMSGGIMEYIHFCERRNQQQLKEIKELFRAQEESRLRCHRENMEMMSQFLMVLRDISKK